VDVDGLETGTRGGRGHLHLAVDALLTKDGDAGTNGGVARGEGRVAWVERRGTRGGESRLGGRQRKRDPWREAWILRIEPLLMFRFGAAGLSRRAAMRRVTSDQMAQSKRSSSNNRTVDRSGERCIRAVERAYAAGRQSSVGAQRRHDVVDIRTANLNHRCGSW
jgi:hypothetical protein